MEHVLEYPFSAEELQAIIKSFLCSRGAQGATEEEIEKVIDILAEWRVLGTFAELAARGSIGVDLVDGELRLKALQTQTQT